MNTVAGYVKAAAETYGRVFFVEYDISDASNATWAQQMKDDWTQKVCVRSVYVRAC